MIPREFEYHAPKTIPDALGLLKQFGDEAKLLAGGHSLLPMMKLRFAQPGHLIDLGKIRELKGIREDGRHAAHRRDDHGERAHLVEVAAGQVSVAGRGRTAHLRSAGALQGHDRRRYFPWRPGQRPSGADAGAGRVLRSQVIVRRARRARGRLLRRQLRHAVEAGRDHDRDTHPRPRAGYRLLLRQAQAQGRRFRHRRGRRHAAHERRDCPGSRDCADQRRRLAC